MGKKIIDPILLEVVKNGFDAIADEIALILMRTAYSTIVRDSMDYSTAICDAHGQTLAQGLTTPLHLGSFYDAMQFLIEEYEGRIYPEDIYIGNDPYVGAGQHLPDIYIIKPIFIGGKLRGWATTLCHHTDVGGIVPGSNALGAAEIFQEGLRLPFLKLYERGGTNQAIWDIIATNVRVPEKVIGDLRAQIAACHVGEREFKDLYNRYGAETMSAYMEELHDYAERVVRAEFSEMPDGTYEFTDQIDGLGAEPDPIFFNVKLTIKGDEVLVDWTGTSQQVQGGVNSPLPFSKAATYAALRSVMSVDLPNCQGYTRAIRIVAPKGTVINPVSPGACGARGITGFRMMDCLFGALSKALPDKVPADSCGGASIPAIGGYQDGKPFVFVESLMGNWGGAATHDGQEGVPHMGANQANVPVEFIEVDHPLQIVQYGFLANTGGPGKFRGGLSIVREYRSLADEAVLTIRSDKRRYPPHGLFGGRPGSQSWNIINPGKEDRVLPVLLTEPVVMRKGDTFRHILAGAGGYGRALDRDPELVLNDVLEEKIDVDHARKEYGVVITTEELPALDLASTRRLRDQMRSGLNRKYNIG
jgi:N-methylhydantoinase B